MKLKVAIREVNGRKRLMLLDAETNEFLPCQGDAVLDDPLEGAQEVTVTFVVDGISVSLESAEEAAERLLVGATAVYPAEPPRQRGKPGSVHDG